MAKPRLVKVRALFYVLQQVMNGREKRVHQNFDTPSYCLNHNWDLFPYIQFSPGILILKAQVWVRNQ